jgi:RNA polymerase sigma factor (sigma-70 family)
MQGHDDGEDALRELDPGIARALAETQRDFLRFIRRRVGPSADVEDLLQQFYLQVRSHASRLRQEDSMHAWLRRVLATTLSDHFRREGARHRAEADFARKDAATPAVEEDLETVVCLCLYRLLPLLKSEYAEVLWRVDLLGEARESVAEGLGTTLNNLTVRLHRARHALRRALELFCETCPIHGYLDCGCGYTKRLRSRTAQEGYPGRV